MFFVLSCTYAFIIVISSIINVPYTRFVSSKLTSYCIVTFQLLCSDQLIINTGFIITHHQQTFYLLILAVSQTLKKAYFLCSLQHFWGKLNIRDLKAQGSV